MHSFIKTGIIISAILAMSFLLGFTVLTFPVEITGHIRRSHGSISTHLKGLFVFVKADKKLVAKTFTNARGDFALSFTPAKEKSFDFYCAGNGMDTLLLRSV
ncbi:MAG TPA: hypothetical protein VLD19_14690, partial [Chitinophagaceae bacterium]|nr:hypothetical protein [Chitinophagaceae bacterium]